MLPENRELRHRLEQARLPIESDEIIGDILQESYGFNWLKTSFAKQSPDLRNDTLQVSLQTLCGLFGYNRQAYYKSTGINTKHCIESFHYSNSIWLSRRVTFSKKNLGNTEDTIQELETIFKKKQEWFIQKELTELYFEKEDLDSAFKMAINAINNFGPLEFKVDLLFLLGKILKRQSYSDLAFKHFSLSKVTRKGEEWKIPQKIPLS